FNLAVANPFAHGVRMHAQPPRNILYCEQSLICHVHISSCQLQYAGVRSCSLLFMHVYNCTTPFAMIQCHKLLTDQASSGKIKSMRGSSPLTHEKTAWSLGNSKPFRSCYRMAATRLTPVSSLPHQPGSRNRRAVCGCGSVVLAQKGHLVNQASQTSGG